MASIAIIIHNLILFETLEPLIIKLDNNDISYDIIIPRLEDQWGEMTRDTYLHLEQKGYRVSFLEFAPEVHYKIALYPYLPYYIEVNADYKIRYQYGLAKPTWNLDSWGVKFDLSFCSSTYDYNVLKGYTRSIITGPIKFANYRLNRSTQTGEKIRLLYLPTYGPECSLEKISHELYSLKDEYDITIKLHHGTSFLEPERVKLANTICERVLDHKTPLEQLLYKTDVILSDGSGAIFDSIVSDTPVIVFQPVHPEKFEGIPALEELIILNDIVPYCEKPSDLHKTILNALNDDYADKRKVFRENYFPVLGTETLDLCLTEIKKFLIDEIDVYSKAAHTRLNKNISKLEKASLTYGEQLQTIKEKLDFTEQEMYKYHTELKLVRQELEEKNKLIESIDQISQEKERNIFTLKETITALQDNVVALKENINVTVQIKELLINKLANNKVLLENLENQNVYLQNELQSKHQSYLEQVEWNKGLKQELDNIYHSKRWRVVNLLRSILEKTKAIYLVKAFTIYKKYGMKVLFMKMKSKLRREITNNNDSSLVSKSYNSKSELNWYEYKFYRYKEKKKDSNLSFQNYEVALEKDLVSIVLPVYNGEDMVSESIESVLNQTYKKFELIIINDGSKDRTAQIIDEYAALDQRIIVVHQENRKIPKTLSRGFRLAQGEYLTWTSADNVMEPEFLEVLVNELKANPELGMVYANMRLIDEKGELLTNHGWYEESKDPTVVNLPYSTYELNVYPNNTIGAAFMYRAKVAHILEDYSSFKHTLEDYDYWMRVNSLFELAHTNTSKPIYRYRFHDKSLTSQDKELGITANRYKLMVLDDYRRDYYLSPMIWVIHGDSVIKSSIISEIEKRGHLILSANQIKSMSINMSIPICNLVFEDSGEMVLGNGYKILCTSFYTGNQANDWDIVIQCNNQGNSSPLEEKYTGVYKIIDPSSIISFIDMKIKNRHLYKIEGEIESERIYTKKLTVIICTYKRTSKLMNAINSLIDQTLSEDQYEIIIVNNDYLNNEIKQLILEISQNHKLNDEFIRYVVAPIKGLSFARNAGLFEARGENLLYLDDDIVATNDLLFETVRCFEEHPEAGVIGGNIVLKYPGDKPEIVRPGMEALWSQLIVPGETFSESNYQWEFPYGANFGVRTDALMRIGGFRTSYGRKGNDYAGGEEIVVSYLMKQIGLKVGLNPKATVYHDVDLDRYTEEHVRKTVKASVITNYQLQKDLYAPMESDINYDRERLEILKEELKALLVKVPYKGIEYDILLQESQISAYEELIDIKLKDFTIMKEAVITKIGT
ncbi:glycosyltransferase [Paenibacillus sp.]|uniref:glycosyltransferase n=1 Tax=Paenibacillus sp. TaxID=58172 RepID=UPI0035643913